MSPAAQLVSLTGRDSQLLTQASDIETVGEIPRCSIVPRGDNPLVSDDNGADLAPETRGALRDKVRDLHEVLIPRWSHSLNTVSLKADAVMGMISLKISRIALAY